MTIVKPFTRARLSISEPKSEPSAHKRLIPTFTLSQGIDFVDY
jgi:hypothetical protein